MSAIFGSIRLVVSAVAGSGLVFHDYKGAGGAIRIRAADYRHSAGRGRYALLPVARGLPKCSRGPHFGDRPTLFHNQRRHLVGAPVGCGSRYSPYSYKLAFPASPGLSELPDRAGCLSQVYRFRHRFFRSWYLESLTGCGRRAPARPTRRPA